MPKNKITRIKSPIVPMNLSDEDMVVYGNQVTYSIRLSNGMIVSKPDDFPSEDIGEKVIIAKPKTEPE